VQKSLDADSAVELRAFDSSHKSDSYLELPELSIVDEDGEEDSSPAGAKKTPEKKNTPDSDQMSDEKSEKTIIISTGATSIDIVSMGGKGKLNSQKKQQNSLLNFNYRKSGKVLSTPISENSSDKSDTPFKLNQLFGKIGKGKTPDMEVNAVVDPEDDKLMSLDEALAKVGSFGRYQKLITVLLAIWMNYGHYQLYSYGFMTLAPAYLCTGLDTTLNSTEWTECTR